MLLGGTMASLAGDGLLREYGRLVAIQRTRVAKQAGLGYWSREVGIGKLLVAWSKIVGVACGVVTNRRLEQVIADLHQVSRGVCARADHVADGVFGDFTATFHALPGGAAIDVYGEFRFRIGRGERPLRFTAGPP